MDPDVDPKVGEFQKPFAQIDILHQKLIKIWPRDILICERVLGVLTLSSNSQCVVKVEIRFYCAGHRKRVQQQNRKFAGPWFHNVKMSFKKMKGSSWTVSQNAAGLI